MAITIAEFLVELGVDASDADKAMSNLESRFDKVGKKADKASKKMEKFGKRSAQVASAIQKSFLAAGAAIGALAAPTIKTGMEFEKLRAMLRTAMGSEEGAAAAFQQIREFASSTPFQVSEITETFIKLKNLGLDPTERNLRSFGNTASAMGKSLNQMGEAVADAITGEFERLKEFGIKASKDGDKATFVFKGVATEIENDAKSIQEFLVKLGEENFGSAMADQMETAGGMVSNLQDAMDAFFDEVARMGVLDEFKGLINDVKEAVGGKNGVARALADTLIKAIRAVRRAFSGDFGNTMRDAIKLLGTFVDLAEQLLMLFAGAKLGQAFASITVGIHGMGVAANTAAISVGALFAAIAGGALIIARTRAEIAKLRQQTSQLNPEGIAKGLKDATDFDLAGQLETLKQREAKLEKDLERRRSESGFTDTVFGNEPSDNALQATRQMRQLVESEMAEREQALAPIGPALPKGFKDTSTDGRKKKKKKKGKKKKKKVKSPVTIREFFEASAKGELGNIAARTPRTKEIEPTVAIDITNNNFKFNVKQTIKGVSDPKMAANEMAKVFKKEFSAKMREAGQQLQGNTVK